MRRKYWWPGTAAEQRMLVRNFKEQIGGFADALELTPEQLANIQAICDAILEGFNITDQCKRTTQAIIAWRESLFYSDEMSTPVPPPPQFAEFSAPPVNLGVVNRFFRFRDLVISRPGYSRMIGTALGIIGAQQTPPDPVELAPDLKAVTSTDYWVNISGSMQGMDAMRVEYAPSGADFKTVAFLTNTPAGFRISPNDPGKPEIGSLRAIFIKRNADYGRYSKYHQIVLA